MTGDALERVRALGGTVGARARALGTRDGAGTRAVLGTRSVVGARREGGMIVAGRGAARAESGAARGDDAFGDPNSPGFAFSRLSSAGGESLRSDGVARADAAKRLDRLEALTQMRELYGMAVACDRTLAEGVDSMTRSELRALTEYELMSEELERAMRGLEDLVDALQALALERDKLKAAPQTLSLRGWDSLFEDPEESRTKLSTLFAEFEARADARYAELLALLPYASVDEAETALERTRAALLAAIEEEGEGGQVGSAFRPFQRKIGRFASRRLGGASEVVGGGITQLKEKPRESLSEVAQYSKGVWARINGVKLGDKGVPEVLKPFPMPKVQREKRMARVMRLALEVQDRDKALIEAQRARDSLLAQGRGSNALGRVALGEKIRASDEKVSELRRVFAVRTLQMEMERIILALEEEVATPPADMISKAEITDLQLMVAEFGVMDLSLRRLISLVDREQIELIDDEDLGKLAMDIPDMKVRLAVNDDATSTMSLEMVKERASRTVEEASETVREAITFVVRGVTLMGTDIGQSARLFLRAAFGTTLRPREVQLLRRTVLDVFTFVPFVIILLIPLTPVGHVLVFGFIQKYFPQLFPSQFTTRRQELMQKYEELKEQLAKAEQEADVANEAEAIRRAVAAVSTVRGMIGGAAVAEADLSEANNRVDALRAELGRAESKITETMDEEDEGDLMNEKID